MSSPSISQLRELAAQGARESGHILAKRFNEKRDITYKGDIDIVTDADKASEAHLIGFIRSRFPDHTILAEESGLSKSSGSGYRWVIDPLDGTTNYAHHIPHFCVSVAVEGPQGLLAGAVYDPMRDELFSAGQGEGTTLNGKRVQATKTDALLKSLLCTGFPYDFTKVAAPLGLFTRLLVKTQGVRRMGAAALDMAYVAAGRFDGFFEFGLNAWDYSAATLLIREAGGVVRSIRDPADDFSRGDILSSCAGLAKALEDECRAFLAETGL